MKKLPPIGAHMSVAKGLSNAFIESVEIGGTAMQIFAKSPMRFSLKKFSKEETEKVKNLKNRNKTKSVVIHASYLLNFSKKYTKNSREIASLVEDIENSEAIDGDGAVIHLGKKLDMETRVAIDNYVENIRTVLEKTKGLKSKVILENTAGQGSEIGFRLDELGQILKKINNKRVAVCIDTAHLFAGGYDLGPKVGVKETINEIKKHISIKKIACVHFNDSKKPLNSRVDRHQDIGKGEIGLAGLKEFYREFSKLSNYTIPFILETTQEQLTYKEQLDLIQSW